MSSGGRLYVSIMLATNRGFGIRWRHLATLYAAKPADCELVKSKARWSLDIGDTSFYFEPDEARQLQETFGLQVRHIHARAAS